VNRPTFTVIAGANGAGKSTLTSGNPSTFASTPVFDPDAFAKTIRSTGAALSPIAAGREVLRLTEEHLKRRQSFGVETTLSSKNYLKMMRYARGIGRGFEVTLIYIGTESVEINLARIAERVRAGGHNVPEIDVRRRYLRSLKNLPVAAKNADHVLLLEEFGARRLRVAVVHLCTRVGSNARILSRVGSSARSTHEAGCL
jgi:predicted ABC-type ATPase